VLAKYLSKIPAENALPNQAADQEDTTHLKEDIRYYQYLKNAQQGCSQAQFILGSTYYHGEGIQKNYQQAVYWYQQAAKQGHISAQNNLGRMYQHGLGVKKDHLQAFAWYKKAADHEEPNALFNLGIMYESGYSVNKNYQQAAVYYRKAAEHQHTRAQYNLGWLYYHGYGVEQNTQLAFKWYKLAADNKDPNAQFNIATMYESGCGISKNHYIALRYYWLAAKQHIEKATIKITSYRMNILHLYSCFESSLEILELMNSIPLEETKGLLTQKDWRGCTPLHYLVAKQPGHILIRCQDFFDSTEWLNQLNTQNNDQKSIVDQLLVSSLDRHNLAILLNFDRQISESKSAHQNFFQNLLNFNRHPAFDLNRLKPKADIITDWKIYIKLKQENELNFTVDNVLNFNYWPLTFNLSQTLNNKKVNKVLQELHLSHCHLNDEVFVSILVALHKSNTQLKLLDISHNNLQLMSLNKLMSKNPISENIDLSNNHIQAPYTSLMDYYREESNHNTFKVIDISANYYYQSEDPANQTKNESFINCHAFFRTIPREEKSFFKSCELINKNKWLVLIATSKGIDDSMLFLEGMDHLGQRSIKKIYILNNNISKTCVMPLIENIDLRNFNPEQYTHKHWVINDQQAQKLLNDIELEQKLVTDFSINTCKNYSLNWATEKLKQIDIETEIPTFKPRRFFWF